MQSHEDLRDEHLHQGISRITNDYGILHRGLARDLSRARAELDQAHTALGSVAHDLRAPLSAVIGFIELLLDDDGLTAAQRDLGERVSRAASTMTTLTEELVEAVTVGASPLRSTPVDLSLVVSQVIARHQLLRPPRGIRFSLDRDLTTDQSTVVQGDQAKLERLVENLVSNAVKFSPDDGVVRVAVTGDARTAEVRVRDQGPGLPLEQLEKIFAPFHRAPGSSEVPGVGLGLTIVKQITERHGGRVHVESVFGSGATFVVRIPVTSTTRHLRAAEPQAG